MKVLLTGPFGKIGYRVIEALVAKGHEPICFDLDNKVNRKTAAEFGNRISVIWGDITNAGSVTDAVRDVDAVIHNAAIIPPLSDSNPALAEKVNVGGTQNIIEAIQKSPKKPLLIFPSSISIHGNNSPDSPWPKKITDPFRAEDCYAGHKIKCEELIDAASQQWGLKWVVVRIGACMEARNLAAGGEESKKMLQMVFSISARSRIEYIHTKDVAAAMANAINNPAAIGKKFFLGGGKTCQTTWAEFNSLFLEAMGCEKFPDEAFGTKGFYTDWMDTEESQRVLQFQQHSLDNVREELRTQLKWIRRLLFPFRPVIRHYLLSQSPNIKK